MQCQIWNFKKLEVKRRPGGLLSIESKYRLRGYGQREFNVCKTSICIIIIYFQIRYINAKKLLLYNFLRLLCYFLLVFECVCVFSFRNEYNMSVIISSSIKIETATHVQFQEALVIFKGRSYMLRNRVFKRKNLLTCLHWSKCTFISSSIKMETATHRQF